MLAVWSVTYHDGSTISQWDETHPEFRTDPQHPFGGEVPYRAIDWTRAKSIAFFDADGVGDSYELAPIPEGEQLSLRSRHMATMGGGSIMWFMLVRSKAGVEVTDESVIEVVYWNPEHVEHICPHFNCPDISKFSLQKLHGQPVEGLYPETRVLAVPAQAMID